MILFLPTGRRRLHFESVATVWHRCPLKPAWYTAHTAFSSWRGGGGKERGVYGHLSVSLPASLGLLFRSSDCWGIRRWRKRSRRLLCGAVKRDSCHGNTVSTKRGGACQVTPRNETTFRRQNVPPNSHTEKIKSGKRLRLYKSVIKYAKSVGILFKVSSKPLIYLWTSSDWKEERLLQFNRDKQSVISYLNQDLVSELLSDNTVEQSLDNSSVISNQKHWR